MTSLNDFIKLEKYNPLVCLDKAMSLRNYSLWSSFLIADGMGEDEIELYTGMKVSGGADLYRLFSLSAAECAVDNQKKIDGVVRFDFVPLCRNPAEFVSAVRRLCEKCADGLFISPFLGIDAEKEPNLFLVDSFFESDVFSGMCLSLRSCGQAAVKKAAELLALADKCGKCAKLSVPLSALKKIGASVSDMGRVHIVNPAFDAEVVSLMRGSGLRAIFTVSREPSVVRRFVDAGVGVSLSSAKFLFSGETLSGFAFRLFSSGLFSKEELRLLLDAPRP